MATSAGNFIYAFRRRIFGMPSGCLLIMSPISASDIIFIRGMPLTDLRFGAFAVVLLALPRRDFAITIATYICKCRCTAFPLRSSISSVTAHTIASSRSGDLSVPSGSQPVI